MSKRSPKNDRFRQQHHSQSPIGAAIAREEAEILVANLKCSTMEGLKHRYAEQIRVGKAAIRAEESARWTV